MYYLYKVAQSLQEDTQIHGRVELFLHTRMEVYQ